jgi:hypothetical protein
MGWQGRSYALERLDWNRIAAIAFAQYAAIVASADI